MSCVSEKPNPHRPRYQRKDACSHYKSGVDLAEKLKDTPSASSADKL